MIGQLLDVAGDAPAVPFDDKSFLPELLDSVELLALINRVENEWGFEFADEELTPELFESIGSLARAVRAKVGESPV